jgi:hypothetical protein
LVISDRSKARTPLVARRPAVNFPLVGFDSQLSIGSVRFLSAVRKAAFDGRNRAFRVRACARAEAADFNTTMIDSGTFLTLQRFPGRRSLGEGGNDLTWRRQCWL